MQQRTMDSYRALRRPKRLARQDTGGALQTHASIQPPIYPSIEPPTNPPVQGGTSRQTHAAAGSGTSPAHTCGRSAGHTCAQVHGSVNSRRVGINPRHPFVLTPRPGTTHMPASRAESYAQGPGPGRVSQSPAPHMVPVLRAWGGQPLGSIPHPWWSHMPSFFSPPTHQ